ncbi:MAG: hypothetical protein CMH59_05295, partial [Myxococcales bacterium]|nr:hypothetical protein [Myxococcales bacterium]
MRKHLPALGITLLASGALGWLLWSTLGQGFEATAEGQRYELLQPRWIVVFAVAPFFVFAA